MPSPSEMLTSVLWVFLVPLLAVAVAALPVSRRRLKHFAVARSLRLTPQSVGLVVDHLTRSRRLRAWGGAAGWLLLAPLVALILGENMGFGVVSNTGGGFVGGAVGFFLGALVAARPVRAPRLEPAAHGRPRRAQLRARRPLDYLTPTAWVGPAVLAVLTVGLLAAHVAWPAADPAGPATATGLALLVGAVAVTARRAIAVRSQPDRGADVRAADDAIRAESAQVTAAAAIALMCLLAASVIRGIDTEAAPASLGLVIGWASGGLGLLALIAWFGMRHWVRPSARQSDR